MYEKILNALRRNAADEAMAEATALVVQFPADAEAHRWLAAAHQQAGDYPAAMASILRIARAFLSENTLTPCTGVLLSRLSKVAGITSPPCENAV